MKKKPVKKPVKKKKLDIKKKKNVFVKSVNKKTRTVTLTSKEPPGYQEKLELVLALTIQTSALELAKNEYVEMAPLPGMCSPFRLSGNSLPVIEYLIFEQKMMEFIKVRVEIAKPDRIEYVAKIDCKGAKGQHTNAERHGQEVPMKDKYKEPFEKLSGYLRSYFPFYRNGLFDRTPDRRDVPKTIQIETEHGPIEVKPDPTLKPDEWRLEGTSDCGHCDEEISGAPV